SRGWRVSIVAKGVSVLARTPGFGRERRRPSPEKTRSYAPGMYRARGMASGLVRREEDRWSSLRQSKKPALIPCNQPKRRKRGYGMGGSQRYFLPSYPYSLHLPAQLALQGSTIP